MVVIRYRYGALVLYPLGEDKEKMRHLRGKKVYAIVIVEGLKMISTSTNQYQETNIKPETA